MKKLLLFPAILNVMLISQRIEAGNTNSTADKEALWLQAQGQRGFLENKGQMADMEGKPVPFVLFQAEAPGLNLWITEKGITLQTLQWRKEAIPENKLNDWEREEAQREGKPKTKKYLDWERIDVELKGASLKKENIVKESPQQGHNNYFLGHLPGRNLRSKAIRKSNHQRCISRHRLGMVQPSRKRI